MTIAIASDHAGYQHLKQLESFLESLGHSVLDFGPKTINPDDDYPDFIRPAATAVASGQCERAVILGGSGQGEAIVANRLKGVRCAVFYGPAVAHKETDAKGHISHDPYEIIRLSRRHNDSNVLSIGARFVSAQEMKNVVKLWLSTPFSGEEHHKRRLKKVDEA